jgi:hypothetical protein
MLQRPGSSRHGRHSRRSCACASTLAVGVSSATSSTYEGEAALLLLVAVPEADADDLEEFAEVVLASASLLNGYGHWLLGVCDVKKPQFRASSVWLLTTSTSLHESNIHLTTSCVALPWFWQTQLGCRELPHSVKLPLLGQFMPQAVLRAGESVPDGRVDLWKAECRSGCSCRARCGRARGRGTGTLGLDLLSDWRIHHVFAGHSHRWYPRHRSRPARRYTRYQSSREQHQHCRSVIRRRCA